MTHTYIFVCVSVCLFVCGMVYVCCYVLYVLHVFMLCFIFVLHLCIVCKYSCVYIRVGVYAGVADAFSGSGLLMV